VRLEEGRRGEDAVLCGAGRGVGAGGGLGSAAAWSRWAVVPGRPVGLRVGLRVGLFAGSPWAGVGAVAKRWFGGPCGATNKRAHGTCAVRTIEQH
jgi:hypothetical protein